ncbi:hypothetical protein HGH93_12070 [Chitinophaga polysaccharea]|uniref:hypothetical protein n=1 Tax=Chitinophaga polysaccharea TaxID=1293035 RepID=UPI001455BCE8|nr:hypothetical protein [Chitinophaga polysaccharea]NLR58843.1 hypothetical protein [Chitinophaga polysaccharea]
MSNRNKSNCKPSFRISHAGHLLVTKGSSRAGRVLASEGKEEKRKRRKRGCLHGTPGTFKLTAKQKKNLPMALQRAIIAHHRRLGKKILS